MIRLLVFIPGLLFGLALPDIDQLMRSLLHHRSILTHSALIPLLLWGPFANRGWYGDALAGLCAGIALHLGADALSPMRGLAQIYWPWPFLSSLGALWSRAWIIGNGLLCLFMVWRLSILPHRVLLATVSLAGLGYAILNERSLTATLLVLALAAAAFWLSGRPARS